MVALEPPTSAPRVPLMVKGPEKLWLVVATLAKVLTPLKYARLPCTAAVEVERPPKEMVGVLPPLEMIGQVPVTLVTPLLIEEVATNCSCPLFQASTCPPIPVPYRVEVACALGTPEPEPTKPRMLPLAMEARETVNPEPPTRAPGVPEVVRPPLN